MNNSNEIIVIGNTLRLSESELLYSFDTFDPADWTIVKHAPKWTVERDRISGGGPDEPTHGQIFFRTPVKGDVVMEFDARILPPSYHDIVWFWTTRFGSGAPGTWGVSADGMRIWPASRSCRTMYRRPSRPLSRPSPGAPTTSFRVRLDMSISLPLMGSL